MASSPTARPLRLWHAVLGLTVLLAMAAVGAGVQQERTDLALVAGLVAVGGIVLTLWLRRSRGPR